MKKEREGKRRGLRRVIRWLVMGMLALSALGMILEKNLEEVILDLAYARAEAMAVRYINEAAKEKMAGQVTYADMMTVRADQQGKITMLEANAARMNELATSTALRAQEMLASAEAQSVQIPLGAALGIPFLSALGTEFASAGINQTRHKIYLSLNTTVRLVIPSGGREVALQSQVLIAESIIVGQVPDSYVNVPEASDALNFVVP